jgi:hypothetical protein
MWVGYARSMGRTLNDGWWEHKIHPIVIEIENGISPEELWKYLEKKDKRITSFRHLVIENSHKEKPIPKPVPNPHA